MAHGRNVIADANYSQAFGNSVNTNGVTGVMIVGNNGWARQSGPTGGSNEYSFQLAGGGGSASNNGVGNDGIGLILKTTIPGANPTAVGIADSWIGGGADYSEYFEWADGNPNKEVRRGYFVTLDVNKIKLSPDSDSVIGIVSSTPGVIGDAAELSWHGANVRDEFGEVLTRDSYYNPLFSYIANINYINGDISNILKADDSIRVLDTLRNYYDKQISQVDSLLELLATDLSYISDNDNYNINGSEIKTKVISRFRDMLSLSNINPLLDHNLLNKLNSNIEEAKTEMRNYITNLLTNIRNGLSSVKPLQLSYHSNDYDPTRPYIPRKYRPEWSPIGLLGKIYVRDNGLCVPGNKCSCENDIAIPGDRWKVLTRSSSNVIQILYR